MVWVKYDLNWSSDRSDPQSEPSYTTSISGYTIPVYIPWAQPLTWPDSPAEFIITAGYEYLGGQSGFYLPISGVAAGSYYKSGAGPGAPTFPYHQEYPYFTSSAVAISL